MSKKKDYSEDARNFFLNEDNKKKKKELEEKYGMLHKEENEDTPPEIMNSFLSNVLEFEEAMENAERKKIKEIPGFPEFKKIEELKSDELETEIAEVLAKYADFNINIDIIEKDEVSDEEFYKFLTEELPEHETDFIMIEGMTTNYIYEEFHPSNKLNVKNIIDWFSIPYLNRNIEEMKTYIADDNLLFNGKKIKQSLFINELLKLIEEFNIKLRSELIFNEFDFNLIDEGKAKVDVTFIINQVIDRETDRELKRINFIFDLIQNDDYFDITGCVVK